MRITGGRARGIPLVLPKRGTLRPATDALRAALFSSLAAVVPGARVLDLFAGTGAYGLEALSRGAVHATWVDQNRASEEAISANRAAVVKSLGASAQESLGRICIGDVFAWRPASGEMFDLVLAGPPYALLPAHGAELLARAAEWMLPGPQARLVLESPGEYEFTAPAGWRLTRRLGKGARQPGVLIFAR